MARETRERSFDELARELASGTLSRRKALRLMGAALVGGGLAALPGVALADNRCPEGQTRCGDRCVNLRTNERHCGSCGNRCRSNQTCCGGRCVNLQTNERHCGSCGNRCAAGRECVNGVCQGESVCSPPIGGSCSQNLCGEGGLFGCFCLEALNSMNELTCTCVQSSQCAELQDCIGGVCPTGYACVLGNCSDRQVCVPLCSAEASGTLAPRSVDPGPLATASGQTRPRR